MGLCSFYLTEALKTSALPPPVYQTRLAPRAASSLQRFEKNNNNTELIRGLIALRAHKAAADSPLAVNKLNFPVAQEAERLLERDK